MARRTRRVILRREGSCSSLLRRAAGASDVGHGRLVVRGFAAVRGRVRRRALLLRTEQGGGHPSTPTLRMLCSLPLLLRLVPGDHSSPRGLLLRRCGLAGALLPVHGLAHRQLDRQLGRELASTCMPPEPPKHVSLTQEGYPFRSDTRTRV